MKCSVVEIPYYIDKKDVIFIAILNEIDLRASTLLLYNKINSLDKLLAMRPSDLLKLRNFGRRSLDLVQSALKKRGLSLKMDD